MTNTSTTSTKEVRNIAIAAHSIEIRKAADGKRSIEGYAVVWDALSEDLGGFREKIQRDAFSESLKTNPDVLCYYGHDSNQILGRVSSGTLHVSEDAKGLCFRCSIPNTTSGNDLIELMTRGDLSQMSFGFGCISDKWEQSGTQVVRTVIQAILFEVSPVGSPAYSQSSVDLRSAPAAIRAKLTTPKRDDDEDIIRKAHMLQLIARMK
jgi:HK97 family phage prohead protease